MGRVGAVSVTLPETLDGLRLRPEFYWLRAAEDREHIDRFVTAFVAKKVGTPVRGGCRLLIRPSTPVRARRTCIFGDRISAAAVGTSDLPRWTQVSTTGTHGLDLLPH